MKRKTLIIICVLGLLFSGCPNPNPDFPRVPFERSYDLYLVSNQDLLTFCGSVTDTTAGFGGIVLFRRAFDDGYNDFVAYDLACTSASCHYAYSVEIEQFNILATCPVCSTKYDLLNFGWPTTPNGAMDSEKSHPLQQYNTYFGGRFISVKNN